MSPRDTYWFLAGTASGLMAAALGVYLLVGTSAHSVPTNTSNLLMPGDTWPSAADASAVGTDPASPAVTNDDPAATTKGANAGALDEVTKSLAERLATKGGTDDEWRLLAQSYDYMGRTEEARAARTHVAATESSRISGQCGSPTLSPRMRLPARHCSFTRPMAHPLAHRWRSCVCG